MNSYVSEVTVLVWEEEILFLGWTSHMRINHIKKIEKVKEVIFINLDYSFNKIELEFSSSICGKVQTKNIAELRKLEKEASWKKII